MIILKIGEVVMIIGEKIWGSSDDYKRLGK